MFEKGIFLCACPPLSRLLAVVALLLMALAAPAAPPAAPPDPAPLEVYGRLPTMSMPVLSPSGDRFACARRSGDKKARRQAPTRPRPAVEQRR